MGRSLLKRLTRLLALVVVVFPIGVGLFLTALGAHNLREASVVSIPKWSAPFGFLVFTTFEAEWEGGQVVMYDIDLDANRARGKITADFFVRGISSPDEAVVGFQIPYSVEIPDLGISGSGDEGKPVPLRITDWQVLAIGNNTSLAYIRFVPSPEATRYSVRFAPIWRDFIVREGFSSFSVTFPVSPRVHDVVRGLFPNACVILGMWGSKVNLHLSLPEGFEVRRTSPLPTTEFVWPEREGRWFTWDLTLNPGPFEMQSVTVSFDVREKMELRNRLFFNSGLYMGLGIGLIISGLHEALKYYMEIRKSD